MNKDYKRVDISGLLGGELLSIVILYDEEGVVDIHVLINIQNAQNVFSLLEKPLFVLLSFVTGYVGVSKQPHGFSLLLVGHIKRC
jgi:hypothetical protein